MKLRTVLPKCQKMQHNGFERCLTLQWIRVCMISITVSECCFVRIIPWKLWDKTDIWSLCCIESILCLRGISWGISERWVNVLCLGTLLASRVTRWNTFSGSLSFQPFLNSNRCLRNVSPACNRQLHHCLGNNWPHLCFLHGTNWQWGENEKEQEELPKHPHVHSEWV